MLKTTSNLLVAAVACLLLVGNLSAADDDKSKDQVKTKPAQSKAAQMAAKNFKNLDGDGDGFLSFDEFKGKRKREKQIEKAEKIFKLLDVNKDLKVCIKEFSDKPAEARHLQMDRDGDGKLTFEEYKGRRETPEQIEQAEKIFKRIDTNGDKSISLVEFKEHLKKMAAKPKGKKGGKKKKKD